jgi:hypothetical protein
MRSVYGRRRPFVRTAREQTRLDLVGLAAEVSTVASCTRERATRLLGSPDADIERCCSMLEEAAARWLAPETQFEALSDDDLGEALEALRPYQRQALSLMGEIAPPKWGAGSGRRLKDEGPGLSAKPSMQWWVL